jgi:hypothetical protein
MLLTTGRSKFPSEMVADAQDGPVESDPLQSTDDCRGLHHCAFADANVRKSMIALRFSNATR